MEQISRRLMSWASILEPKTREQAERASTMPFVHLLITGVGPGSPQSQHESITTTEPAAWSAYRDLQTPNGFASFDFGELAEPSHLVAVIH